MIDEHLKELSKISAEIGNNTNFIQGAGGNTSIKLDNILWVKASGTWLANALEEAIFVPLDLIRLRHILDNDPTAPIDHTVRNDLVEKVRRSSIETTLHALLDHDVVVHTHSIAAIAAAVRKDAADFLADHLSGLAWTFVPYVRPGAPLTKAIQNLSNSENYDILVLGNHGLVVGATDCRGAMELLNEVEKRLKSTERKAGVPNKALLERMAEGTRYILPTDVAQHNIATNDISLRIASGGSLYPDHVVFLGPGITVVEPTVPLIELEDLMAAAPKLLAVRDTGVLLRDDLNDADLSMIRCLADVVMLVNSDAKVNYLSTEHEMELLDWDAEKLRQRLNS